MCVYLGYIVPLPWHIKYVFGYGCVVCIVVTCTTKTEKDRSIFLSHLFAYKFLPFFNWRKQTWNSSMVTLSSMVTFRNCSPEIKKKTWNAWNQLNISFWYLFFTWHAQRADRHLLICYEGDNSNKVNANENNKKHTFRTAIDSERNNNQDINDEQGVCFFFTKFSQCKLFSPWVSCPCASLARFHSWFFEIKKKHDRYIIFWKIFEF